jgi:hypothetical protein
MKFRLCILLVFVIKENVFSQGCSDAGFCSIGNIHTTPLDSGAEKKNKLSLLFTNGIGDQGVYVFTPGIQYEFEANAHLSFQSKITGNYASGNLGTASGAGDLFLSSTYLFNSQKKTKNSITLGVKLPLNTGDLRFENNSLPMQYQSSLGTVDLIIGYKLGVKRFSANFAWQQPLTGRNRNTFLPQCLNTPAAYEYVPSNDFDRKGDVLLRVAYQIISKDKWQWNSSLLSIYHLGEDTYIDGSLSNNPINIAGSEGLTLNITSMLTFKINKVITIGLSGGMPLVVRKVRPDGLTRAFALTPEVNFNF